MPVTSSFTPLQWKNGINPKSQGSFQTFMKQLADWANNIQNQVTGIANLPQSAPKALDLGVVSSNQSIDCTGASTVVIFANIGISSFTLTLNNLTTGIGVWVIIQNGFLGSVFMLAAKTPALAAYTVQAIGTSGIFNMGSGFTTATSPTFYTFFGNSAGSNLWLSLT